MAGANITKKSLAASLKALAEDTPFSKITVEDICERCNLNRTSFYYHFKDKYDLANWIFDTEVVDSSGTVLTNLERGNTDDWDLFLEMCQYLYTNRGFYSSALQVKGQNSMIEHFRELYRPIVHGRLEQIMGDQPVHEFHVEFFTDAVLCAIERWITDRDCLQPEEFVGLLRSCMSLSKLLSEEETSNPNGG